MTITNYEDDLVAVGGINLMDLESQLRRYRVSPKHAMPHMTGMTEAFIHLGYTGLSLQCLRFLTAPMSRPANVFFDAVAAANDDRGVSRPRFESHPRPDREWGSHDKPV